MILLAEILICCFGYGAYIIFRIKRDPAYKLRNMPIELQKKVIHMRGFRDRNLYIMTDLEKFVKKIPVLIAWTILLVVLTSVAGAKSFSTGFVFSLVIWLLVLIFIIFVVYCGWYAHSPGAWIKNTEYMADKAYKNYFHYVGLIPQRAFVGLMVAILVGVIVDILPRLDYSNYETTYVEINDTLEAACEDYSIPGMAVEVVNEEKVVFSGVYGECESIDTPFVIGSLSKSVTAACIMKLREDELLNLDDSISRYISPKDDFKRPSDADKITVRQLLNHTSGLGVYQHIGNARIVNENGKYTYANINYNLLGEIIENVSGLSYNEYARANIFSPLEMKHSTADYNEAVDMGLISGSNNYFGVTVHSKVDYPQTDSWSTVSSGYIASSASDMGKYLQMYLRSGYGVLSDKSMYEMMTSTAQIEEGTYRYGMGWVYSDDYNEPVLNHTGLVENYISNMYILPESGIGVVFLANTNDYLVTNQLMDEVTAKVMMTLMGYATDELDSNDYVDAHLFYNLIYASVIGIALMEIAKSGKWKVKSEGNLVINLFMHLFAPIGIIISPVLVGIPYWVIKDYVPDLFWTGLVSVMLLFAGGILKIKHKSGY